MHQGLGLDRDYYIALQREVISRIRDLLENGDISEASALLTQAKEAGVKFKKIKKLKEELAEMQATNNSQKSHLVAVDLIPHSPITKKVLITRFSRLSGTKLVRLDKEMMAKEQHDTLQEFLHSNQEIYKFFQEEFKKMLADIPYYEHLEECLDVDKDFQITIGDGASVEDAFFKNKTSSQEGEDIALNSTAALYALKRNKNRNIKIFRVDEENFHISFGPVSLNLSAGDFLYLRPQTAGENNEHSEYVLREFERIDTDGKIKVVIPKNDKVKEEKEIQDTFDMQDIGMIPVIAISSEEVCKAFIAHGAPIEAIPENMRKIALAAKN